MTPTATQTRRTKPQDVLGDLDARERKWTQAVEARRALTRDLSAKTRTAEELEGRLRRLYLSDPEQFDRPGEPKASDSQAGQIASELGALGDLGDLRARADHAGQLEQAAKQSAHDYIAAHLAELVEAIRPDAEACRDEVQRQAGALADAAQRYLGMAQRVDGWRACDRSLAHVRVPAIDEASHLLNSATGTRDKTLPLPSEMR